MPLNSSVFSKMVGRSLLSVRENCVTPSLINHDLAADLAQKGQDITINFAGAIPIRDVVPGPTPPATAEPTNNSVTVTLNNWKEAAFVITDKDLGGLDDSNSYISQQLEQAGRTVANAVDDSVLNLYKTTPFYAGVAGTTPFASSTAALQEAERNLITNLAPGGKGNRKLILDPFAHANALGLPGFQNAQAFGGTDVIREGVITRALGYDWGFNQNMKYHTRGAAGGTPLTTGPQSAGATTITTDGWPDSTAILNEGDIILIAGDPSPYVVTAAVTSNVSGVAAIPISNGLANNTAGLRMASVDNSAITVVASHRVSLALHPMFAAFASRPVDQLTFEGMPKNSFRKAWIDPISGLALTVKISEQHYQHEFSISCLWAVKPMWTQFAVRVLG